MKKVSLLIAAVSIATLSLSYAGTAKKAAATKTATAKEGFDVGNKAPELKYKNPEGKEVALSSLKGKLVLIDFWASWCGPCRMENPNVVSAYNKYKDGKFKGANGFTVYGVSLDKDMDRWKGAIAQDKLTWTHVSDLGGWQSAPAVTYHIQSIPANFLLDANGIIIGKDLRGPALDAAIEQMLQK